MEKTGLKWGAGSGDPGVHLTIDLDREEALEC
jgi:hypothetical protein